MQQLKPSYTAGETTKGCSHFGNTKSGNFTQNVKHSVIKQPGNSTPRYTTKRNEKIPLLGIYPKETKT